MSKKRIVKNPVERREEILDVAERLFLTKGYNKTTIIDILTVVGIAKGTFYYYFKSKEEVLNAIIQRQVTIIERKLQKIIENQELTVIEKFRIAIFVINFENLNKLEFIEFFHEFGNAEMHQKSLVEVILTYPKYFAELVRQGKEEDLFHTDYPYETMEFLFVISSFLFDEGIFHWNEAQIEQKMQAFIAASKLLLGLEKDDDFVVGLVNPQLTKREQAFFDELVKD